LRSGLGSGISAVEVEFEISRLEGIAGDEKEEESQRDQERNEELHVVDS
jgi:3-oxoacyl-ACP reductase-like protein